MTDTVHIELDALLAKELKKMRITKRESYSEVIERILCKIRGEEKS